MKLKDAPVGLFEYNGELMIKTVFERFKDDVPTLESVFPFETVPVCYFVESGRLFQNNDDNLKVKPLEAADLEGKAWLIKPKKHKVKVRRRKANANPDHA